MGLKWKVAIFGYKFHLARGKLLPGSSRRLYISMIQSKVEVKENFLVLQGKFWKDFLFSGVSKLFDRFWLFSYKRLFCNKRFTSWIDTHNYYLLFILKNCFDSLLILNYALVKCFGIDRKKSLSVKITNFFTNVRHWGEFDIFYLLVL